MLRRSLSSDASWMPAPHVRSLRSQSTYVDVAEALRIASLEPHPAVRVNASSFTEVHHVRELYANLAYDALLILVADVERLAVHASRHAMADALSVTDLAGWDWVVLIGSEAHLLAASRHIDARLAGRIGCVVRTSDAMRQLVAQLQCLAFRAPVGFGPNAPWPPSGDAELERLPARTVLALRRLRSRPEQANVKLLAFLAGVSRRQLERQFDAAGLGTPADFVALHLAER